MEYARRADRSSSSESTSIRFGFGFGFEPFFGFFAGGSSDSESCKETARFSDAVWVLGAV